MSKFKEEIEYLKNSTTLILKALIIFFLSISGLLSAIYLRFLGYNGTIISFFGIIIEIFALFIGYLLFRRVFFKTDSEKESVSKNLK